LPLKRSLSVLNLVSLGVGAIVDAGIFRVGTFRRPRN
jgi:hypothetical protein